MQRLPHDEGRRGTNLLAKAGYMSDGVTVDEEVVSGSDASKSRSLEYA
jgi:hypothetical protein